MPGVSVEFAPTPGTGLGRRQTPPLPRQRRSGLTRYPRLSLSSRRPARREIPGWVIVGGIVAVLCVGGGTVAHTVAPTTPPAPWAAPSCTVTAEQPAGPVAGFSGEQLANAATILAVGQEMGLAQRAGLVALATAMQESRLRNLDYGDRDSLGLFQQRPSMGWGTPAQVRDPRYAARRFYEGLQRVPGWQSLPVTVAAQRVQRSAFPSAYAKWESAAASIVAAIPTTCTKRS